MQGKVCGKKRHTKTEIRSEMLDLICGRIAAGENYNLTRDRFECRLSIGLFIWNCCICSREMEVEEYEHYDAPKCYPKVFCNLF